MLDLVVAGVKPSQNLFDAKRERVREKVPRDSQTHHSEKPIDVVQVFQSSCIKLYVGGRGPVVGLSDSKIRSKDQRPTDLMDQLARLRKLLGLVVNLLPSSKGRSSDPLLGLNLRSRHYSKRNCFAGIRSGSEFVESSYVSFSKHCSAMFSRPDSCAHLSTLWDWRLDKLVCYSTIPISYH
nr:hypothetical protein HmN_000963400 [Hymenolepis microstoma]